MAEEPLLRSMPYQAVGGGVFHPPWARIISAYWTGRIARLRGDLELKRVLRMPTRIVGAAPESRLALTLKAHKEPGLVSYRNLHCSVKYAMSGVIRWLHRNLTMELESIADHLLKGPKCVVSQLRGVCIPLGTCCIVSM